MIDEKWFRLSNQSIPGSNPLISGCAGRRALGSVRTARAEGPERMIGVTTVRTEYQNRANYYFIPQTMRLLQIHTPNYWIIPLHQKRGL